MPFQSYCKCLLFQCFLGVHLHAKIKKFQQPAPEKLQICYLCTLGMPRHVQSYPPKKLYQLDGTLMLIYMQKINFIPDFLHKILHSKNPAI